MPAQPPPAKGASGRYLLILDTSAAMRRRAPAVQKAVSNLLLSSMHGQLQRGDTVGLWTYNEQLYAGRLPLQRWTPEDEQLVASNIVAFIQTQPFEKKSRLDSAWPAVQSLVEESEKLTVLLISDGSEKMSGTPFDREINEFFKANSRSQEKKRMPFVTVLRSHRGKFIGVTLNLAPWPAELPPLPPEPSVAAAPKPKPPPKKTAPQPTAPPLIVIGKKPEPPSVTPPAPTESTPAKPAAPTNSLPVAVVGTETTPEPAPAQTPKPPPTNAVVAPTPPPTTKPVEAGPTPAAATAHPKPEVAPVAPQPVEPAIAKPPPVEASKPATAPVVAALETKPASPPVVAPPTESVQTLAPAPVKPEPSAVPPPERAQEMKPEPASQPETVREIPAAPPAQTATATQPEKSFNPKNLLIIGGVALVLAVALFLLLQRRARATPHASLITRSMDQDKK